ncbi:MAG: nuclear transport factor 2 family protein [Chitinophagaceae bacterium]|nr:nuclear transport factor 2 family protein [Chitinophagaceae bacterium]
MTIQNIAELFSSGQFAKVYQFLSEKVIWDIVGEKIFIGKKAVIENCEQTSVYFRSITTKFKTENIIVGDLRVAIDGTAEFVKERKRIAFVRACDVYHFNKNLELEKITSYCIQDKK